MPITIRKAVEVLDVNVKEASKHMPPDVKESLNLSIATLKAVMLIREGGTWDFHALLPGEAPEQGELD